MNQTKIVPQNWTDSSSLGTPLSSRSSSREVRIRLPLFFLFGENCSRGTESPNQKSWQKGTTGRPCYPLFGFVVDRWFPIYPQ